MRLFKTCLLILLMIMFMPGKLPAALESDVINEKDGRNEIVSPVPLMVDDIETEPENRPFLLSCGRTIITLEALQNLIPFQSEQGKDGELVILWEQTRIQIFPGQTQILVNAVPLELELSPITTTDGNILLPLRNLAEVMGYKVLFDDRSQTIQLYSPGFQPLPRPDATTQPEQVDFSVLPVWGSILSTPGLTDLWPEENVAAGYFTRLVNSPAGRTNNVALSAAKINGRILQADEIFSFNQTVGPRTVQNGYQNAKIFAGKTVVTGIGGGICQTSSTMYNAALEAGLQVLERWPHSLHVVYAPPNRDATVSWGGADFKFRNTSGSPLKVLCKVENGYVFAAFARIPVQTVSPPVADAAGPVLQTRFFKVSEPL